jgi:hypothetical protein
MEKILSTSNALRLGTCLSSVDHSKLKSSAKKDLALSVSDEAALTSEVVQVVCGVCHHPLDTLKPLQPSNV